MSEAQAWYHRWAVVRKTFPGHRGRPGQVGGSLPREGAGGGFGDPKALVSESAPMTSSAKPTIVEFEDGSKGLHKYNENVAYGHPAGEVLTYEVANALGWDIVPKTVNMEREGGPGTLQEFVPDSETWYEAGEEKNIKYEAPAMVLLDAITGNRDRGGRNILEDSSGKIRAIDNNGAFGFMWRGDQKYYDVSDFTENLIKDLAWHRKKKPEQFASVVAQYDSLFADIAKFAERGGQAKATSGKIFEQTDAKTAYQFTKNVHALARYGKSAEWRNAKWRESK